jgi:hypothetical protein
MIINSYYYSLIIVFSILCFLIVIDQNVSDYITLVFKLIKINIERFFWMVRLHPKNPITNFMMKRRYSKLAKELHKELIKKPLDE